MDLHFDPTLAKDYRSSAQVARILTESWVAENMFCPHCGNTHITHFPNNRPVADFFCPVCHCEYELKSKSGKITSKINDGAYDTMIRRITSNSNPDFFFMNYSKKGLEVKDFFFVPKHFFVPDIIEKRKPLADSAKRAGWVGCNILVNQIPEQGRIPIVLDGIVQDYDSVIKKVGKSLMLKTHDISARGWLLDVLNCINQIPNQNFTLQEMYNYEQILHIKHPQNSNVRAKIRQQLQFLRDKGFVEFLGNGNYRKTI